MADTSTTLSQSSEVIDYPPGRGPYEYKPILISRPLPSSHHLSHSAFILDFGCRLRWTRWFKELLYGPQSLEGKTPEEVRELSHQKWSAYYLFEGRFRATSTPSFYYLADCRDRPSRPTLYLGPQRQCDVRRGSG